MSIRYHKRRRLSQKSILRADVWLPLFAGAILLNAFHLAHSDGISVLAGSLDKLNEEKEAPSGGIIEEKEGNLYYYGDDIDGVGLCGRLEGCKTLYARKGCGLSGTGVKCDKCFQFKKPNKRNVMNPRFYSFDGNYLKGCKDGMHGCPNIPYIHEMASRMLLKDDDIARMFQSAQFKNMQIPNVVNFNRHYSSIFCTDKCRDRLRQICTSGWILPNVREWCLNSLDFIKDRFSSLRGPASYVLFLAARLGSKNDDLEPQETVMCRNQTKTSQPYSEVKCEWPQGSKLWNVVEREEKAALVAAAAMSVFLSGHWWTQTHDFNMYDKRIDEFGYAVQHSLWMAIWAGRLRITLQPRYSTPTDKALAGKNKNSFTPGTATLCGDTGLSNARNFEGKTGSIYASLCALFPYTSSSEGKLRYRMEMHTRHTLGCVEKVSGMVFVRPGDWFKRGSDYTIVGKGSAPRGLMFTDDENLTTFEMTRSGNKFYPPSIAVSMRKEEDTLCTEAKGNGPNYEGLFAKAGLTGVGGLCSWVPVW